MYILPHGLRYFGNPRKSATTDHDPRKISKPDQVTSAIDTVDSVPEGCEIWIRPSYEAMGWRRQKTPGWLVIYWADHRYRQILNEMPSDDLPLSGEVDSALLPYFVDIGGAHVFTRLDDEYRYWSYVEMHPAHVVLTRTSTQEAADALHWSYTDRLLSHPQRIQPPFSQGECQGLNGAACILHYLVISDSSSTDPGQQSGLLYTHMVARILLRLGAFFFCIDCTESLVFILYTQHIGARSTSGCTDLYPATSVVYTLQSTSILRTVLEIVVGMLCLGIPFLFVDRARYSSHFVWRIKQLH